MRHLFRLITVTSMQTAKITPLIEQPFKWIEQGLRNVQLPARKKSERRGVCRFESGRCMGTKRRQRPVLNRVEIVFRPNPEDVPEIMRRTDLTLGQPFIQIPEETRPDEHKVLAVIDGQKIRREHVEMVFNDTVLMNFVYAQTGHRSEDHDPPHSPMAKIRELARQLYGSYGEWVEANYGVICMECSEILPRHNDACRAGKRSTPGK